MHYIGIDIGGTNIKAGVCDAGGRLLLHRSIPTEGDRGFDHVFARIVELCQSVRDGAGLSKQQVSAVGVGVPGPMSHARGVIFKAPNLAGWVNVPLRDLLQRATGFRVVVENDANSAAYGEHVVGAGRGHRNTVMLTLGTGIGGGIILDGQLLRGHFDNAGEIGHMIVVPGGRPCPCGQQGCLERYASATAAADRAYEAILAGAESSLAAHVQSGRPLTAAGVEQAMVAGDALAVSIWDDVCDKLALGIVNIQHLLNPELVVLAGGLINAGDRLLEPVRSKFRQKSWQIAPDQPQIELATLGADAGAIGAAMLARSAVQRDA